MPATYQEDAVFCLMKDIANHDIEALRMPDFDSSAPLYKIYYADTQCKKTPSLSVEATGEVPIGTYIPQLAPFGEGGARFVEVTLRLITRREPRRDAFDGTALASTDNLVEHMDTWHRIQCRLATRPTNHSSPVNPYPDYATHVSTGVALDTLEKRMTTISSTFKYPEGFMWSPAYGPTDSNFVAHQTAYETFRSFTIMADPS